MINAIKFFVISTVALELIAALYHCACAPISGTMQAVLGIVLTLDLIVAPFLTPAKA